VATPFPEHARKSRWGPHRLGHFAARRPWIALALVAAASALAVFGVTRVERESHSLSALFQSDTTDYRRYEQMRQAFPLNERDLILVATSDTAFKPAEIELLRELHLELQLTDGIESVLSLFSIREEETETGYAPPLVPDEMPDGAAFSRLMAQVAAHPFVANKLLRTTAAGGQSLVIVVGMSAEAVGAENLVPGIDAVSRATEDILAGTDLERELLGVPVMQRDVRLASRSDRLIFNVTGFFIGLAMCFVIFRNPKLVAVATLCPAITVLWTFGMFGLVGFPISFFMNAIPPLVMVICFAEVMHLTWGISRRLREGDAVVAAVHNTVSIVGPASALTTITTSAAFLSLLISDADVIRDFGLSGAIAIVLIFATSMLVVPSLAVLILSRKNRTVPPSVSAWATEIGLDRASEALARWVPRYPLHLTMGGVLICLVCAVMYLSLEPRFRLSEQVPDHLRERIAEVERTAGLAGASPVYIVVRYPAGESITGERLRRVVGSAHDALSKQDTVGNVWSLALIQRQFADKSAEELSQYIEELPPNLKDRLLNDEAHALLVTGHFPDLDAREMSAVIASIEADLAPLRAANSDLSIEITGITAVAALHASTMIQQLNGNFALEVLVVMVIIGAAFRSFSAPLIAFLPNIFPILASGALLYLLGLGLDYAGIIALTVAFGLAVDDTVHFVARFQYERREGQSTLDAVKATVRHIAPVMVITSVVIVFGMGITVFGQMPQTRAFGAVVIVTLFSALAAELLLTPAIILAPASLRRMLRSRQIREDHL
jgi:predicted RND superfamily exporter protein